VPVRLLTGPVLQPIRDGSDNLADRVPMPAHLEALGHGAHDISSQAHASLGVVRMRRCRASVSVARQRALLATDTCRSSCEKERARGLELSWDIITLWEEADPPW